jgi:hypothetical protein
VDEGPDRESVLEIDGEDRPAVANVDQPRNPVFGAPGLDRPEPPRVALLGDALGLFSAQTPLGARQYQPAARNSRQERNGGERDRESLRAPASRCRR